MHRRPVHSKRNNRLNVLIAGSGGCGKSTLVNALCGGHEVASTTEWLDAHPAQAAQPRPLKLKTYTEDMADSELGSVTLRLVESQGFGDNLDNRGNISDISKYIAGQYDEVLAEESRIKRNPRFTDNRVHAVVYMIEATGHGLREQDIEFMRQVGPLANVIPVIAKADALTPSEVLTNKRLIVEDIERYKLPIYQFASTDEADAASNTEEAVRLQEMLPLAIVASSKVVSVGEREATALVREYPWGWLRIEDPKISDFSTLREVLLYSHLEELKEVTNDLLYENYRTQRLSSDPEFNAAESAARAPTTASRANLAEIAGGSSRSSSASHNTGVYAPGNPYAQQPQQPQPQPVPYPQQAQQPYGHQAQQPYALGQQQQQQQSVHSYAQHAVPQYAQHQQHQHQQPTYVSRENILRAEEAQLMSNGQSVENDLELRRQELLKRELELQRLEERLRQESQQLNVPPSQSLQQRINKLGD